MHNDLIRRVETNLLTNLMEKVVDDLTEKALINYDDICKCPICVADIKAITLNKIPPQYVTRTKGVLFTRVNNLTSQFETDIIKEIGLSIEIVSKNPQHD